MECPNAIDVYEHFAVFERKAQMLLRNWRRSSFNQQLMRPDIKGEAKARIAWATDKVRYNASLPNPVYDLDFVRTESDDENATVTIPVYRQELLVLSSP